VKELVDEDKLTAFHDLAKGLNAGKGLSQEDAQKLVDYQAEWLTGMVSGAEATQEEWKKQAAAHPLYGGSKVEQSDNTIAAVLNLADNNAKEANYEPAQGLRQVLEQTGVIHHPAMRAFLAFTGDQLIGEPSAPRGEPRPTPPDAGDISTSKGRAKVWYTKK
jgi:hypothetical protein